MPGNTDPEREWLDYSRAARYVGMSTRTLRRWVQAGKVQSVGEGKTRRFRREWLDKAMNGELGWLLASSVYGCLGCHIAYEVLAVTAAI